MHTKRIQSLTSYPPIAFTPALARAMLRESVRFWTHHNTTLARVARAEYRTLQRQATPMYQQFAEAWRKVDWTAAPAERRAQMPPKDLRRAVYKVDTRLCIRGERRERLRREGRLLTLASAYLRGTPFKRCENREHTSAELTMLAEGLTRLLRSLWRGAYPLTERRAIREWLEVT